MRNFFKGFKSNSQNKVPQVKSFSLAGLYSNMFNKLTTRTVLSVYESINYYQNCAPVYAAVKMIADEVASIEPYIFNNENSEFLTEGDVLTLLKNPNPIMTGNEFLEELASYFLVTGNCFIIAHGEVNRPPKELFIVPPYFVTLQPGADGCIEAITVSGEFMYADTFYRKEIDGKYRYYSGAEKEIWFIKEFNPRGNASDLWGMSKLMPIHYEIEQYMQASVHNLNLLLKGGRPSGALEVATDLTDDQFERLKAQTNTQIQGASNAGQLLLLESGITFKEMSMSNKDMDFTELKRSVTFMIYSALKIPLPLISGDFATYSNLEVARLSFYDNAVLPLLNRLYAELTQFLFPRFNMPAETQLFYSADEIIALEPRANEEINKIKSVGVLTINELRKLLGYEPLVGGDVLYGSSSELPVAEDAYTQDQIGKPTPKSVKVETREDFVAYMRKQKNKNNKPKYSESYIQQLANQYGFTQ
jgi:HK97 family phage portal protein